MASLVSIGTASTTLILPAGLFAKAWNMIRTVKPCSVFTHGSGKRFFFIIHALRDSEQPFSIVSVYGLNDRTIGVRSRYRQKDFSSNLCVQTGSGAHPAFCTMVTGGPFPGGEALAGRDADHSHLVPRSRISRSYTSFPPPPQVPSWRAVGQLFSFLYMLSARLQNKKMAQWNTNIRRILHDQSWLLLDKISWSSKPNYLFIRIASSKDEKKSRLSSSYVRSYMLIKSVSICFLRFYRPVYTRQVKICYSYA
jgi:hypothetical protein